MILYSWLSAHDGGTSSSGQAQTVGVYVKESDVVLIRQMELADIEQVTTLCAQWGYPVSPEQLNARFNQIRESVEHQIFVASLGEAVCGWVHIHGVHTLGSDPYAEIRGIVVDANNRQQGVGRQLMLRAEKWALDKDYQIIRLRSGAERPEAHSFYPSVGYERTKTQHVYQKFLH